MNRKPQILLLIFIVLVIVIAGAIWVKKHAATKEAAAAAKPPEEEGIKITHGTNGNVMLHVPDEMQGNAGITVAKPEAAQFSPEIKAYGRVLDTAPLAAAMGELLAERIAADYSRREFERMKTLKGQNNASERAFQTAEETYVRDQAALKLTLAKIRPIWGDKITEKLSSLTKPDTKLGEAEMDTLLSSLTEANSLLIRVDLPAGENLDPSQIKAARLVPVGSQGSLNANATPILADYFGVAPNIDPQTQGRGLFFLLSEHPANLLPGAAVTAFIQLSEQPVSGVVVPLEAIVRTEGSAWVYLMGADSDTFTRTEVSLDHPIGKGWFVSAHLTTTNYMVVTGAQTLLSQETKPAGGPD